MDIINIWTKISAIKQFFNLNKITPVNAECLWNFCSLGQQCSPWLSQLLWKGGGRRKREKSFSLQVRRQRCKERLTLLPPFNAGVLTGHTYLKENFKPAPSKYIFLFISLQVIYTCFTAVIYYVHCKACTKNRDFVRMTSTFVFLSQIFLCPLCLGNHWIIEWGRSGRAPQGADPRAPFSTSVWSHCLSPVFGSK